MAALALVGAWPLACGSREGCMVLSSVPTPSGMSTVTGGIMDGSWKDSAKELESKEESKAAALWLQLHRANGGAVKLLLCLS